MGYVVRWFQSYLYVVSYPTKYGMSQTPYYSSPYEVLSTYSVWIDSTLGPWRAPVKGIPIPKQTQYVSTDLDPCQTAPTFCFGLIT